MSPAAITHCRPTPNAMPLSRGSIWRRTLPRNRASRCAVYGDEASAVSRWCLGRGTKAVGAVVKLMDAGYRAYRVAGTSAGSVVGAIVAAAAKNDQLTGADVKDLALGLNYRKFLDPGPIESVPLLGPSWGILQGSGLYKGDYAHDFIAGQLTKLGGRTFGDLRLD